jgi:hypothetical protein
LFIAIYKAREHLFDRPRPREDSRFRAGEAYPLEKFFEPNGIGEHPDGHDSKNLRKLLDKSTQMSEASQGGVLEAAIAPTLRP